ncbi:MAG TPA: hypothetical protein VLU95_01720 [Candidatus Acidoferrum sp.]|nr:hypothetical protein [Candidatus Acidoferrum sp.]
MAFISDKNVTNSVLTEESVVAKVVELMETLDHVKKYNALARLIVYLILRNDFQDVTTKFVHWTSSFGNYGGLALNLGEQSSKPDLHVIAA